MKVAPQVKDRRPEGEFGIPSGGPSAPGRRLYFRAAAPVGCDHGTRCRPGSLCCWPTAKFLFQIVKLFNFGGCERAQSADGSPCHTRTATHLMRRTEKQ